MKLEAKQKLAGPNWQFNVTGVFEAASHRRSATQAIAMYHVPEGATGQEADRIKSEAERLGVGVVWFEDPDRYESWDIVVEPERYDADPMLLDDFVRTQLDERAKDFLHKWSR